MAVAAVEVQRRAGEVRPVLRRVVEFMVHRTRVEQQGRFGHAQPAGQAAAGAMADFHVAAPQHVQEGAAGLRGEPVQPAQRSRMEKLRPHAEPLQQGGQAVDRRRHDGSGRIDMNCGR
ncbi:hypothetical protein D3C72_1832630 [compost metagenome]